MIDFVSVYIKIRDFSYIFVLTCLPRFPFEQRAQGKLFAFIGTHMQYDKPALSYQEQLALLKNRGLVIANEERAIHLLKFISYYRLSGYWYPMLEEPKTEHLFKEGSKFQDAFNLYCFDRELRQLIGSQLEKIEIAVRATLIYNLSHDHNPFWFEDQTLFSKKVSHARTLTKIEGEFKRSDEDFIKKFKRNYKNEFPPSWMALEVCSFGSLSKLYENLKPGRSKREIASIYGLSDEVFGKWLHVMVYLRNLIAHHSRCWNKILSIQPIKPRTTELQWLINEAPNNRIYFSLSIILYLLQTVNPNQSFSRKIRLLIEKYPDTNIRDMGFPENWQDEPLWN